jgi:hypothetical protein
MPARAGDLDELRGEALYPSVDADVIDGDAALGQKFLDIVVGQSVAQIPADRDRDHLTRRPEPSEHRRRTRRRHRTSLHPPPPHSPPTQQCRANSVTGTGSVCNEAGA